MSLYYLWYLLGYDDEPTPVVTPEEQVEPNVPIEDVE